MPAQGIEKGEGKNPGHLKKYFNFLESDKNKNEPKWAIQNY